MILLNHLTRSCVENRVDSCIFFTGPDNLPAVCNIYLRRVAEICLGVLDVVGNKLMLPNNRPCPCVQADNGVASIGASRAGVTVTGRDVNHSKVVVVCGGCPDARPRNAVL